MGFTFTFLCNLLSRLEENRIVKAAAATAAHGTDQPDFREIRRWFAQHDRHINHDGTDRLALLSCMFPEKRIDRVFWLQETSLARVIGRCLGLGSSRLSVLNQWQRPGGPDLGKCVENVMREAENDIPPGREVTTEEIDMALGMIASRCRFSGPEVRRQHTAVDVESTLRPLYRRLRSRDAKWLTRMILKSYAPVIIPSKHALERFHFLLPHLLQFQNTFEGALRMLDSEPMKNFPSHPNPKLAASLCAEALEHLQPQTGIKIGRPEYFKARSIKHCYNMANRRRMSVERKYDGEYCQIHVDLTDMRTRVQIFSKSGKESTDDRSGIIQTLKESLRIGSEDCMFSRRCILEGELVAWSDERREIAGFHKLRTLLSRSGTFIGVDNDSPPQPGEHLMIVFFDILVLDDDICLRKPHRERRLLLKNVVKRIDGWADLADQLVLDFGHLDSRRHLEANFSRAIANRWEGYVLKACDEPYFPIYAAGTNASFGRWIKLKKDYIEGLGDTVDLALVGAYYDSQDAAALSWKGIKWTHFLVGCLLNKEAVIEFGETPHFRIVDALNRHCMHRDYLRSLSQHGDFSACDPDEFHSFRIEYGCNQLSRASVLFKKPFVVESLGSGFERPSGARYYALRFPRIRKIHTDRTFEEAASFQELQMLADEARSVPTEDFSDEVCEWGKRLKVGNGLNEYRIPRSRSLSSTCSSESESGVDSKSKVSRATSQDSEEEQKPGPLATNCFDNQTHEKSNHAGAGDNTSEVPIIHLDETDSSPSPGDRQADCSESILVENENLACRQSIYQTNHSNTHGEFGKNTTVGEPESQTLTSITTTAHCPRRASGTSISVSKEHDSQPVKPSQVLASNPENFPRSPLTTIPVYMSGPSDGETTKKPSHSGVHEFIKTLNSQESIDSLSKSNPLAARHGLAFGIVLVDSRKYPLGEEIRQMANAILEISRGKRACIPSKCKIFFLDSALLEQDIQPEDLNFCERRTWSDFGHRYFYACLQWEFDEFPKNNSAADAAASTAVLNLSVTFDESEILALGEHITPRAAS